MKFSEIVKQASLLLQDKGQVSYRMLKREFNLDDEALADLKAELIEVDGLAVDQDGKMLVWVKDSSPPGSRSTFAGSKAQSPSPPALSPASYTPPHLAERIRAEQSALEARGATDGERKTITALFADIKDSTALIEDLDPEEARQLLDPALQLMMDAVHRYEGYVAQALGDGIFALFGAPIAHEDHPQRALYAALRMQEEGARYAEQLRLDKGINLQIRIGINTGEVVVRSIRKDDLHTDYVPVGHSTNLASRMESLASGGAIVVSEHTQKLTAGYFHFKALGAAQVKGVSEPIAIYEVLGVGPLRTKLQVAAQRGLARFVGRQGEIAQLQKALELAKVGHGQIVSVMGEPGVGKSRLFYEFKLVSQTEGLVLETFSVSHGKAYPYLPLIDLLHNYFHITLQDDERRVREKVTGKVLTLDRALEDTLPYLFSLLSVSQATSSLPQMDPQIRRRRTFEAIRRLLLRESLNQPLIVIFEDLHWLDSETQAFLSLLSESIATAQMLLLVNYRPEYRHEWGHKTYYTQLRLDPLGVQEAQALLTALLGESSALQPLKQQILLKTEGNPFFIEEMVQTLLDQGILVRAAPQVEPLLLRPVSAIQLPATVQAVLAARMDRLAAEEKELLQTLAVIGKEFSWSLLTRVVDRPEEELQRLLFHLQAGEFLYEKLAFPDVEYTFKHALTQEVAYNSLLLERRKLLHERTAQAIEALFHFRLEDHYSELAQHYSRSGNLQKAVDYLQFAGQQAVQRSAHGEALHHVQTALALLEALPASHPRAEQELLLHITLGPILIATQGYAAPEVESAYARARELCHQVGETPQLFPVLWGLSLFYLMRAEHRTACELGAQLLRLAESVQDRTLLLQAHLALGFPLFWLGNVAGAHAHLVQGLALYDPLEHGALAALYGQDSAVLGLSYLTWSLWQLGTSQQARERNQELLLRTQQLSHPFSLAMAFSHSAWFHQLCREALSVQAQAETSIALAREQGFPFWVAQGTMLRGWALVKQKHGEEGIAQLRQGLAAWRATGAAVARPQFLAMLAEAYGETGQVEEGLEVVSEALTIVDNSGERQYEAELYRLKGTLTLRSQVANTKSQIEQEAEECFHKAIEIAHQQQAKSLELRASTSIARLWQQQGKRHEAHKLLSEIYGWFTEGFDTTDLQEAKALLAELGKEQV